MEDVDQGLLVCHPAGLNDPLHINIAGRSSFITAYGDRTRESISVSVAYKNFKIES